MSDRQLNGELMVQRLAHRGPDHQGAYKGEFGGRKVYLGHRRLSIIDLSEAGNQPMATADDEVIIVYNGEVYNFVALKEKYLPGRTFRSRTDTEVLLYLYEQQGPSFVSLLNGDFAIAILDKRIPRLYLFRDRLGVKPLYYYRSGGTLAFGSEVKALLATGMPVTLSEESLQKYFAFKYVPQNDTMHREIKRIGPGCFAEYDPLADAFQIHTYWKPARREDAIPASYEEATETLRSLLGDAVQIRLVADVPVGTFLSGGIDSSAIASYLRHHPNIVHYCARKSKEDLKKEGTTSDYAYAHRLAKEWGITLHPADIGSAEATRERIRETLYYSDDLIADGSHIPSFLITEAASHTSRVMLSGMGADELFLGYASHMLCLLALYFDRLPAPLARAVAKGLSRLDQGRGAFKAYRRYLHKFGKYYPRIPLRYGAYGIVGDLDNSLGICSLDDEWVLGMLSEYFQEGEDPFDSLFRFELDNFLVKNLHYFDRMCMANSVEGRVPFMDHRLVEWAYNVPRSYKLSASGRSKKIMKDAFAGILPGYILERRKAGFGMPLRSILSNRDNVEALLDVNFLGGFSFFSMDHIHDCITAHLNGSEDNSALLYALVSFQEWYKLFHVENIYV